MEIELDERMTEETKTFVGNQLKAMLVTDMIKMDLNMARGFMIANAEKTNEVLKFPNVSISKFSVKNPSDGHEIEVTCYTPADAKEAAPMTVFFHGGGWTYNSVSVFNASISSLASSSKTIWFSVEYRLSPEHKYPIPVNDCVAAFKYVHANRERFGGRNAKIGVAGDSAGGHLASLISHDFSDLVDHQILVYPVLYLGNFNVS